MGTRQTNLLGKAGAFIASRMTGMAEGPTPFSNTDRTVISRSNRLVARGPLLRC